MIEQNFENIISDKQNAEVEMINKLIGSEALTKACFDPFDYALKLRTGEVIRFHEARVINAEWIHIKVMPEDQTVEKRIPYIAERGMDIRIADIVWVMDAPMGS